VKTGKKVKDMVLFCVNSLSSLVCLSLIRFLCVGFIFYCIESLATGKTFVF